MASDLRSDIQNTTGKTVNARPENGMRLRKAIRLYVLAAASSELVTSPCKWEGAYPVSVSGGGTEAVLVTAIRVGGVPDATEFVYTLHETGTSDFNWIMLPLDKAGITMASGSKPISRRTPVPQ